MEVTGDAFEAMVAPYRSELLAHCYRMLGSLHDAEDALQESLVRAWRGAGGLEDRGLIRAWLYKIATNRCLTALERRGRRELPVAVTPDTPVSEIAWLEPFPGPAPEADYLARETLQLAFVAALQHLSPIQRAALILREVLEFSAAEVAEVLDTSVASVNSSLQRARATLRDAAPAFDQWREPADPSARAAVERYLHAFEAADVPALTRLLADDVIMEMPPVALWLSGRTHYREFMERIFTARPAGWRMTYVEANGSPALATWAPDRTTGALGPHSLQVFTVTDGQISSCVTFADPTVLRLFNLPDPQDQSRVSTA